MEVTQKVKIIYIHGFNSSGTSTKVSQLKKEFKEYNVIAPDFSPSPKIAIQQLRDCITKDLSPTIVIGTSLGGFYATYLAARFDIPAFIINPSLEPHITLKSKVGKYQRYGNNKDYEFRKEYLNDLEDILKSISTTSISSNNLHFYLSKDDEVLSFDKIHQMYPNRKFLKVFATGGHRFTNFPQIFPDIHEAISNMSTTNKTKQ